MMGLGVDLFWPPYAVAALVIAVLAVHVHAYRRTTRPIAGSLKAVLLGARLTALGLIIFILWRPAAETETVLSRKARLALLVDSSKSMSIWDEETVPGEPASRLARAAAVFSENEALWRRILELYDVAVYSFSRTLEPAGLAASEAAGRPLLGLAPDGPSTALGDAVEAASRLPAVPEVILILSDGLSNSGADPLDAAVAGSAAVYAVSVGSSQAGPSTRDVAVTDVRAADAYVGSEAHVGATVSLSGLESRTVRLALKVDGKTVDSRQTSTALKEALEEVTFSFKPEKAGPLRVEVEAEPLPDEIVSVNNAAATYVDVKQGGLRVLYVETFRQGAGFLRRALQSAQDIDLRFIVPSGEDSSLAPAFEEDWDVYIIGDVPAAALPDKARETLAAAVDTAGKGVLFLGGDRALGRGGYGETPLAKLIPFAVDRGEALDRGEFAVKARPVGPAASILSAAAGDDAGLWAKLPPVMSVNLVADPRAGASVLLEGEPVRREGEAGAVTPDPSRRAAAILAVQEFGKGRSAAFAAEGAWKWATGAGLTDAADKDAAAQVHTRLWRQIVFWLARREERGGVTINLTLARHRVNVGDKVFMEARVLSPELKPLTDVSVTAEITSANGARQERRFWIEGDRYRLDFEPPLPGDYRVRVAAVSGGTEVASRETALVAPGTELEFLTLVSRPSILEALARGSGGRHAAADGAAEVLSDIHKRAAGARYVKLQRMEIWSSYWYATVVLLLLLLEWALRKISGLI